MCCVVSDEEVLCGSHESMEKATEVIHARYCVFFLDKETNTWDGE